MRRWYLVHTKPLGEVIAEKNLERQGYEVYFPRVLQTVRRRQGWREEIGPLFPRYLFLHLDEGSQSLNPVHSTLGVTNVVRFGPRYAIVPGEIVAGLRAHADPTSSLYRLGDQSAFSRGECVTITAGPFEGLAGIFERGEGCERVLILLDLLGQDARVELPIDIVVPTTRAA